MLILKKSVSPIIQLKKQRYIKFNSYLKKRYYNISNLFNKEDIFNHSLNYDLINNALFEEYFMNYKLNDVSILRTVGLGQGIHTYMSNYTSKVFNINKYLTYRSNRNMSNEYFIVTNSKSTVKGFFVNRFCGEILIDAANFLRYYDVVYRDVDQLNKYIKLNYYNNLTLYIYLIDVFKKKLYKYIFSNYNKKKMIYFNNFINKYKIYYYNLIRKMLKKKQIINNFLKKVNKICLKLLGKKVKYNKNYKKNNFNLNIFYYIKNIFKLKLSSFLYKQKRYDNFNLIKKNNLYNKIYLNKNYFLNDYKNIKYLKLYYLNKYKNKILKKKNTRLIYKNFNKYENKMSLLLLNLLDKYNNNNLKLNIYNLKILYDLLNHIKFYINKKIKNNYNYNLIK
jgi:hypothetical protein